MKSGLETILIIAGTSVFSIIYCATIANIVFYYFAKRNIIHRVSKQGKKVVEMYISWLNKSIDSPETKFFRFGSKVAIRKYQAGNFDHLINKNSGQ